MPMMSSTQLTWMSDVVHHKCLVWFFVLVAISDYRNDKFNYVHITQVRVLVSLGIFGEGGYLTVVNS